MPRLSKEWGMPANTDAEMQAIMDRVAELPTFRGRPTRSKLGRWFSWNQSAKENLPDYFAAKMVIEDYLFGKIAGVPSQDPDETCVAFDDLKAATNCKTPQAELAKLRQNTGGFELAYKLMSSGLLSAVKVLYVVTKACWDYFTDQT